MIEFVCPHCSHKIKAQINAAGIRSRCPSCKANITVPMPEQSGPIRHEEMLELDDFIDEEEPAVPQVAELTPLEKKKKRLEEQLGKHDWGSKFLGCKEIKRLPEILWDGEEFETLIQGVYNGGLGILVATSRRLIFIDKKMFFGIKVEDFPYDKISSISYETGIIHGKINLYASGNKAEISQASKVFVKDFVDHVRTKLTDSVKVNAEQASNQGDKISALERLASLRDSGVLSDEEFQREKQSILNRT